LFSRGRQLVEPPPFISRAQNGTPSGCDQVEAWLQMPICDLGHSGKGQPEKKDVLF
jgi:hypothetical protein